VRPLHEVVAFATGIVYASPKPYLFWSPKVRLSTQV